MGVRRVYYGGGVCGGVRFGSRNLEDGFLVLSGFFRFDCGER